MSEYEEYVCTYMQDNWGEKYRPHLGEEIVRCRDCEYYMDYEHEYEPNLGYCGFHDMQEVRDSRFCAWAKRKDGGDD